MDRAGLRGRGSNLCHLLLPGEGAAGWGAVPRVVVTISEEKALLEDEELLRGGV